MNNSNHEVQKDEIELLKNILFDRLTITSEHPNFHLEISCKPDIVDEPKLDMIMNVSVPDNYPDTELNIEVYDNSNLLASTKIKSLISNMHDYMLENLSMPMIYQLYEILKVDIYINK